MRQNLGPAAFHILIALGDEPLHGLGIAEKIERATDGELEMGGGTLYRTLKQLLREGLIRDVDPPVEDADPRRRYYAITPVGKAFAVKEAARLESLVTLARKVSFLPPRT
jgi:DNA-binding PadR family transcriptional regulator